ncbi:MAG: hypothetical protein HND27_02705 [Bacteroidetes bacterium]|nr:hypothetical protein [Bacteroidota bacterium]MBV6462443.1 hypothetical protein [Flavobacteriales bacterium]WKZ74389.1 MAG: hypothetical protein QY303_09565 [Vicingaceae bacterium]MCL4816990.1 hypothetical protein [Flavobacteriales bacterium]NOG94669.1 hypothetical protein [Bacteroidota bacterium]
MDSFIDKKFIRISLLNLLIVALLGVLMRYKIGFEFNYFDQKNLQHAHSHFAFTGWISQTIMILMVLLISKELTKHRLKLFKLLLFSNLMAAYGMLISFAISGYSLSSIIFSSISILTSFLFSYCYFKNLNLIKSKQIRRWFGAALFFNIISSLGTFALVYMMITKKIPQHNYLASVYWYLHFQYNGWYLFACIGLFLGYVQSVVKQFKVSMVVFWLFATSCIPAYGLSVLWLKISPVLYILIILAAIAQYLGGIIMLIRLRKYKFLENIRTNKLSVLLFIILGIALAIKLSLQLGSTIPAISKLAFGFRPIVIAYLHLALLAITSVFLITYIYATQKIKINYLSISGIILFVIGVYLNEIMLAVQGIASFSYTVIPGVNGMLLGISLLILFGIFLIYFSQLKKLLLNNFKHDDNHLLKS